MRLSGSLDSKFLDWTRAKANTAGLDPATVAAIIHAASYSSLNQTRLFETICSRDSEVKGAVQQRILALMSGQWDFVPADDLDHSTSARAANPGRNKNAKAQELIKILKVPHWKRAIRSLGWYSLMGYSIVQIEFKDDGSGHPKSLKAVPFGAIDIRLGGRIHVCVGGSWLELDKVPDLKDRFIVLTADDNDPSGEAVMRAVAGPWITKFYAVQDWAIYSEKLGDPPITIHYQPGSVPGETPTKTAADILIEQVENLKGHSIGAFPKDVLVELLQDARLDASRSFYLLLDQCDRWIKRAILTSETTMQSGAEGQGSRAADSVRAQYGLDTVIQADGEVIQEVLQEQYVDRVAAMLGFPEGIVKVKLSWKKDLDSAARVDAAAKLKTAGFYFDEAAELEELGFIPRSPEQWEIDKQKGPVLQPQQDPNQPNNDKKTGPGQAAEKPPANKAAASVLDPVPVMNSLGAE